MLGFAIASVEIKRYEDGELKVLARTPELNGEILLDASAISNLIRLLNHVKDTMSGKSRLGASVNQRRPSPARPILATERQ